MDTKFLEKLVERGESQKIEFKKTTGQLRRAFETLCGFLNSNSDGGWVIFGVSDEAKMTGQEVSDSTLQEISHEMERLEPFNDTNLEVIESAEGVYFLVIEANPKNNEVYVYDGRPFKRVETTTRIMDQREYKQELLSYNDKENWE